MGFSILTCLKINQIKYFSYIFIQVELNVVLDSDFFFSFLLFGGCYHSDTLVETTTVTFLNPHSYFVLSFLLFFCF